MARKITDNSQGVAPHRSLLSGDQRFPVPKAGPLLAYSQEGDNSNYLYISAYATVTSPGAANFLGVIAQTGYFPTEARLKAITCSAWYTPAGGGPFAFANSLFTISVAGGAFNPWYLPAGSSNVVADTLFRVWNSSQENTKRIPFDGPGLLIPANAAIIIAASIHRATILNDVGYGSMILEVEM